MARFHAKVIGPALIRDSDMIVNFERVSSPTGFEGDIGWQTYRGSRFGGVN